ncbi:MAG: site-specific tyrosine recombinase XerC [Gemmataceae bacterium]|nr:site-specific tyrosine recombinase XerC [Gemmataceae bacterium]
MALLELGMPSTTAADLVRHFLGILDLAASTGRTDPQTRDWYYYQFRHLLRAKDPLGAAIADRDAAELVPEDLAGTPYTFHFVRAVRCLFRWAHASKRIPEYRFGKFQGPPCGQRERVLSLAEYRQVTRRAGRALRTILPFLRRTLARPGELRGLRWRDLYLDKQVIRLTKFKARDRRRDNVRVRVIPLTAVVVRWLRHLQRVRAWLPDDHVFVNSRGRPWTKNALRLAMHRAAAAAGVNVAEGERVVCYTLRHTGATEATRRGVRDRALADILGHTSTRTTARYQHLAEEDLVAVMETATGRGARARTGKEKSPA